ncbi:MAG: ABC transporter permease [Mycobacterium sp.]
MTETFLYWHLRTLLAWSLALIAMVFFAATTKGFLSLGNLFALGQAFAVLALVASGLTVVMLMGQFDLSITAVFPLTGLVAVKVSDWQGPVTGILVAMGVGLAIGAVNGLLTAVFRIPSLAVTIGTMVLAIGVGHFITGGELVQAENYQFGLTLTNPVAGILSVQSLIELAVVAAILVMLGATWLGRYVYAIGENAERASASAIPVRPVMVAGFLICGLCAALGGALQGTALATGQAGTNDAFLLQAATAAVLGGIALTGGRGSLVGTIGAALLLAMISNGLSLAGADSAAVQLVNGVILLAVVLMHAPLTKVVSLRPQQWFSRNSKEQNTTRIEDSHVGIS